MGGNVIGKVLKITGLLQYCSLYSLESDDGFFYLKAESNASSSGLVFTGQSSASYLDFIEIYR
jgi:hypothetical protein